VQIADANNYYPPAFSSLLRSTILEKRNDILTFPIHLLYICIQLFFKSTIGVVGPNVDLINSKVNLKMKCIIDILDM
jgi:hypothetical protein